MKASSDKKKKTKKELQENAVAASAEEAKDLLSRIEEVKASDDPKAKADMLDLLASIIDPQEDPDTETEEEKAEEVRHPAWAGGRKIRRTPTTRALMIDVVLVILIGIIVILVDAPGKVMGLKVTDTTFDTVSLSWEATQRADGYHIYRSEDGGDYNYIATARKTSYKDIGVTTGKTYRYSVTAYNSIRRQGPDEKKTVEAIPSLDTPELKGDMETGKIKLSFTPVKGAIGYEIYRNGKKIADQKETEFTDEKAHNDKTYRYEVKAYRYRKNPVYSAVSNRVKLRLVPVNKMEAEIQGESILFTWAASDNYSTYELYNGDELLGTIQDTQYMIDEFDPEKKYEMKLVGISEDGEMRSPANRQTFEITSTTMTNQEARDAACDWAVMIADDNRFTYGTGKRAHRCGCYFCGTNTGPNKNIKGSSLVNGHSYEMTYCCNPFVHACYAHGAGDPGMLAVCQRGGSVGMSAKSYTRFGNWKKVGKPSKGSLQRGDVLVRGGHVSLYIGDGMIAQAVDKGWTDESIRYNNLSDGSYAKYKFVMRYTGNGAGTKYEIHEVDNADESAAGSSDSSDKAAAETDKTREDAKSET